MALEPGGPPAAVDSDETGADTPDKETTDREATDRDTTTETPVPAARPPVTAPVFTPLARTETPAGSMPDPPNGSGDGPLLPDADELRANWQRVQASFVDDPHTAVAEAADLVGHVVQALTGALRQRQARPREQWVTDGAEPGTGPGNGPDTERLRVTLQQYRAVLNQICRD